MTTEEKQIELLNRQYTNIEHYKSLRLKIPTLFGGIIIALTGYILNSDNIPKDANQKFLFAILILFLGVFGIVTYRFVQNQYKDIAEDIHYLWSKLKMNGSDYFKEEKGILNSKTLAPKIFLTGYLSILILTLIGIISIFI